MCCIAGILDKDLWHFEVGAAGRKSDRMGVRVKRMLSQGPMKTPLTLLTVETTVHAGFRVLISHLLALQQGPVQLGINALHHWIFCAFLWPISLHPGPISSLPDAP